MVKKNKLGNSHFKFLFNEKLLNSKRSQGHVEVILSFVIFIGFLIFIFIFLNPFATTKPSFIMDNIERGIVDEISTEIGRLSVIVVDGKCYDLTNIPEASNNYKGVEVYIDKYNVYFSNEVFSGQDKGCSGEVNDTLGVYSVEKMIVYSKIVRLVADYKDYETLKARLGITNDFVFDVKDLGGVEVLKVERNVPAGIDVEARNIPIRVINANADIQELILNIRAW